KKLLARIIDEKLISANAVYGFWPAVSEGDTVVLYDDVQRKSEAARFPMLRQQEQREEPSKSLADFVLPAERSGIDYVGAFRSEEAARAHHRREADQRQRRVRLLARGQRGRHGRAVRRRAAQERGRALSDAAPAGAARGAEQVARRFRAAGRAQRHRLRGRVPIGRSCSRASSTRS